MIKLIYCVLLCFSVAACSTTPTSLKEATQVPADRIYYHQPLSSDGMSKAIFVRDRGYLLGGGDLHLFINGTRAASLETGERLELLLTPDEYLFGVKPTDYFGAYNLYSIDQILQAGKTYYYRLLIEAPYPGGGALPRVQRFLPEDNANP
jgi:hypothetical protein